MQVGEGEAKTPPQSTSQYEERLQATLGERALVAKGMISAHQDLLNEDVKSYDDVLTLLGAAKNQLAEPHPQDVTLFLFSYVEELERILARLSNQKREGEKYDG